MAKKVTISTNSTISAKTKAEIKKEILAHVKSKYPVNDPKLSNWKVGITNKFSRRKKEMLRDFGVTRLPYLQSWETQHVNHALEIEKHFCDLGMIRCNSQTFHIDSSIIVYAYVLPSSIRSKK
jgi:hypothetical protein